MIVPMKKITVVVQAKDKDATLNVLAEKGVLHIEHQNTPLSENISLLEEKYRAVSKALEILPDTDDIEIASSDTESLLSRILSIVDKRQLIEEDLKKIKRSIEIWKEWGDFDPEIIDELKHRNIWVQLCTLTKKEIDAIPEGVIVEELFKKGNIIYCAVILTKEIELPFRRVPLPDKSLREMFEIKRAKEQEISRIDSQLSELAKQKKALFLYRMKLNSRIEFSKVSAGMGRFERLLYLRGYCPVPNLEILSKTAQKEKWGLIVDDPDENDNVPTLIKNPRWIEIIKPVFEIIKTIPGYREVDISLWFLLFLSVFFGILIGDAGYGLVFLSIALFSHKKFGSLLKDKSVFFLTYVLSLCAIIWGVLTGTFFGQAYLTKRIEPLLPFLRDNVNLQALCFFIGATHLSIAHIWRLIQKLPSIKAFSETGWIAMLWAAYFLAKSLILGQGFPVFAKWLLAGGAALIVLFTNPNRKKILKGIGAGIGDFLLHIVNSFTDIVSYIRLFAVGTATVAVADAFNQMASGIGYSSFFSGFLTAIVLFFGHTLNILLGAMAILVHGVRLNVLEFSSHLNMEWSGTEYKPFKEIHNTTTNGG